MSNSGLEGVVVAQTRLSAINGEKGELIYGGYDIDDLARHTTFEEVAYLLWNGELPGREQLEALNAKLVAERQLDPALLDLLRSFPKDADPMAVLRTAVSALGLYDPTADDLSDEELRSKAILMTAKMPTIIAAHDRIRNGNEPVEPRTDLDTAANFLYMLNATQPDELRARTLDAALVLHAEHGMNASTFAARVTAGTLSDIYSAIVSAIGTLKGPSHGGANMRVMEMLNDIDQSGEEPGQWVRDALGRKQRIMGFGHRVYKAVDPRAIVLRELADEIMHGKEETKWLDLSDKVRAVMSEEMEKAGKPIYPNVDFFSASVYTTLGIPMDLFTPVFAMSRITGWTAHLFEQYANNRLIRPKAEYTGPRGLKVTPIEQR
ncbi:MAG TPA: citrate/2-methylcitrate synthase [Longimicrobiaceae bacterium]|nr:citrate/2-methylcitrate synthase [Longimicrobiaceae bacterium]